MLFAVTECNFPIFKVQLLSRAFEWREISAHLTGDRILKRKTCCSSRALFIEGLWIVLLKKMTTKYSSIAGVNTCVAVVASSVTNMFENEH